MGHRIHRRPSWNYCTYQLISLAFISGSIVLYASYLCLSLIYCLTHVECFRFFMAANIDFVWRMFEASLQLAFDMLSTCLRHAHASLRPGLQPGLQLARIMECGLYCLPKRIIKISPNLSKLQLAKVGAFFETQRITPVNSNAVYWDS